MLIAIPLLLIVLYLCLLIWTRKRTVVVDSFTFKVDAGRDDVLISCRQPDGKMLFFEAFWSDQNRSQLQVEFPSVLSFSELLTPDNKVRVVCLDIPAAPSTPDLLSEAARTEIQRRLAKGLQRLNIRYQFVPPQLSGWTSFESGTQILHANPGLLARSDQER